MTGVYDTCFKCGVAMTHEEGRGKAKKFCSKECKDASGIERKAARVYAQCSMNGCTNPANRVGAVLCEVHYYRKRRGVFPKRIPLPKYYERVTVNGYVIIPAKGHPRSTDGRRAFKHRVVYTDVHGEGPFNCKWCSKEVTWTTLHIDHLDDNPLNNHIDNLAASCPVCNQQRGHEKFMHTLRQKSGVLMDGELRTLNEWAAIYGISRPSIVMRLKAGWDMERAIKQPRGKFGPKAGQGRVKS